MGFNQIAFLKAYLGDHYNNYKQMLNNEKSLGNRSRFYKETPQKGPNKVQDLIKNTVFPPGTTREQKLEFARSVIYCGNANHPWLNNTTF